MPIPHRSGQPIPSPPVQEKPITPVNLPSPATPPPRPPTVHIPDGPLIPDLNVLVEEPASFPTPTVKPIDHPAAEVPGFKFPEKESNIPGTFTPDEEPFFRNLDLEHGLGDLNFERDFAQWFNAGSEAKSNALVIPRPSPEKSDVNVNAEPVKEPQATPLSPAMSEKAVQPVSSPVPEPPLRATFISDNNILDGHLLPPGAEFVKSWKMLNDGLRDWPETTQLVFVAGDKLVKEEGTLVKVGKVAAGEEIDIWTGDMKVRVSVVDCKLSVVNPLQAPENPGKYVSYWRLNDGNGNHFGHSLWAECVTFFFLLKPRLNTPSASLSPSPITLPMKREPSLPPL